MASFIPIFFLYRDKIAKYGVRDKMEKEKNSNEIYNSTYKEIFTLDQLLTDAGIQHEFENETWEGFESELNGFYHIYYPSKEDCKRALQAYRSDISCSVIEGFCTIGNTNDRLELMGLLTENESKDEVVVGNLTAIDIFNRIKAAEEKRKELFRHTAPVDEEYLVKED